MSETRKRSTDDSSIEQPAASRRRRDASNGSFCDLFMTGQTRQKSKDEKFFQLILEGKKIKDVCWMIQGGMPGAGKHAFILLSNGNLVQWGKDQESWSSISHNNRKLERNVFLPKITQVNCGYFHAAAVAEDGSVFTWGTEIVSSLGRRFVDCSCKSIYRAPGQVIGLANTPISQVACSMTATLALDQKGKVFSWGRHDYGITGQGETEGFLSTPTLIRGLSRIKQISASRFNAGALTDAGKVFTWGETQYSGHVDFGEESVCRPAILRGVLEQKTIIQISCGEYNMGAISDDGDLFCWGDGSKLGRAEYTFDGTAEDDDCFPPEKVEAVKDVSIGSISFGEMHSLATTADGSAVYAWGWNACGEGGMGRKGENGEYIAPQKITVLPKPGSRILKARAAGNFSAILSHCPENQGSPLIQKRFNNKGTFPNVEFIGNGEVICHAHKSILCLKSEYFAAMFRDRRMMSAKQTRLPVQFSKQVFLKVMEFIYEKNMGCIEPEIVPELYEAANHYNLSGLRAWCFESLEEGLTLQNVGSILQEVSRKEYQALESICLEFITAKRKE